LFVSVFLWSGQKCCYEAFLRRTRVQHNFFVLILLTLQFFEPPKHNHMENQGGIRFFDTPVKSVEARKGARYAFSTMEKRTGTAASMPVGL
jgi:hypothetical protein